MLKLQVILGSTRPNRAGEKVADWVMLQLKDNEDFEVQLIDVADANLPLLDEPATPMQQQYTKDHTKAWSRLINEADAYIFVTGEYNHSIPGALKNAIDYLNYEWRNKPFGLVSYGSAAGGARAAEHLRQVGPELHMASVRDQILVPHVYASFNEDGSLQGGDGYAETLDVMLDELKQWGEAFKAVRQKSLATAR